MFPWWHLCAPMTLRVTINLDTHNAGNWSLRYPIHLHPAKFPVLVAKLTNAHCHISSCTTWAGAKVPCTLPAGKFIPLPMPQCPWSHVSIDFLTNLPESQGNTVIIIAIDCFSKSLCLIPLLGLPIAFKIAEHTFNHMFHSLDSPRTSSVTGEYSSPVECGRAS